MCNVPVFSIGCFSAWHCDKKPFLALDHLDIMYHKFFVNGDGDYGFHLPLLCNLSHPYVCNVHFCCPFPLNRICCALSLFYIIALLYSCFKGTASTHPRSSQGITNYISHFSPQRSSLLHRRCSKNLPGWYPGFLRCSFRYGYYHPDIRHSE